MGKAYLVFEDGTVFEGIGFGAERTGVGEAVFTTGVVGYLETLTDPCSAGQIVVQTFPLLGNYGIVEEDLMGRCAVAGYVVREWCDAPSNFRSQYDLDSYLRQQGVPGICGVDTRAITRKLRDGGAMRAMICDRAPETFGAWSGGAAAAAKKETAVYPADGEEKRHVAVVDNGAACFLLNELRTRGCRVTVVSPCVPAEELLALNADGVILSEGPGDPAECADAIALAKALLGKTPLLGVGLGHQVMALAAGARVEKLRCGHRGGNQPVRDREEGCTYITGQNHGYAVVSDSVTAGSVRFVNANDNSCEGIDYPGLNAFSVQFRPESVSGPRSTAFVFERFISMMGGESACR